MTHREVINEEDGILVKQYALGAWREKGVRVERMGSRIVHENEQRAARLEFRPVVVVK
jgi:hypothetical protein